MNVTVTIDITPQQIADQFVAAFEGGTGYWLREASVKSADPMPTESPWYSDPKLYDPATRHVEIAVRYDNPGKGARSIRKVIGHDDIKKGLQIMADKYAVHFGNLNSESRSDAETADVFMQCIVLGEVVYG